MAKNPFHISINNSRIYGLDILRALAIIFVVLSHGNNLLPSEIRRVIRVFILDGVSIFFVLSGFLIGGILIKLLENNNPTKKLLFNFWLRRWFRTLPNYFLILICLSVLTFIFSSLPTTSTLVKFFFFLQNLFSPHPRFFSEAWSLSIEEWFYLIVPLSIFVFIWLFKTKPKRTIEIITILIILAVTLFRLYRFIKWPEFDTLREWDIVYRKQVITRLDSLMYGVLGAYIQFYVKDFWLRFKTSFFLIGLLLVVIYRGLYLLNYVNVAGLYQCVFSFSVTSISVLLLLPFLSNLKNGKGVLYKGITIISLISYSMYLIHLSLIKNFIIKKIPYAEFIQNAYLLSLFKYSLYWFLTISVSVIIYKYFEIPTTNWRESKFVKKVLVKINS